MKRRSILFAIIGALLVGCGNSPDPIDRLVRDYSANGMWKSGIFPILGLSQTANQEQVIKRALEMHGYDLKQVRSCKILRIRRVYISPSYPEDTGLFAALIQMDVTKKIVLFKFEGNGWWNRVCAIKTPPVRLRRHQPSNNSS
jgi:hypothetical protein